MTRIIAGLARGRRLRVPAGAHTRPTSDRAREGLFSSLLSLTDLAGARVLDLYAGSGALGLEALSRGAGWATLVERDPAALHALRANVAALGLPNSEVVDQPVERFLVAPAPALYRVALIDPPYELDVGPPLVALHPRLEPDAVVVVERSTRDGSFPWPQGYRGQRSRRYGQATLWYGFRS